MGSGDAARDLRRSEDVQPWRAQPLCSREAGTTLALLLLESEAKARTVRKISTDEAK
jgi:hypothetical protein